MDLSAAFPIFRLLQILNTYRTKSTCVIRQSAASPIHHRFCLGQGHQKIRTLGSLLWQKDHWIIQHTFQSRDTFSFGSLKRKSCLTMSVVCDPIKNDGWRESPSSLICSANMLYSKREPLQVIEYRIWALHEQLSAQARTETGCRLPFVTMVHPLPEEFHSSSVAGSLVSTISIFSSCSSNSSGSLSSPPWRILMAQFYQMEKDTPIRHRRCSSDSQEQTSSEQDNGWGHFVDDKK
jgi:hypothetical protein